MARPLRILAPDGWYHVFGRGWNRCAIFGDDRDREHFLELLEGLHERCRFRIHEWSSYRAYAGYCAAPTWLRTDELWRRAHKEPSKQAGAYRSAMKKRLTYGVEPSTVERLRDVIAVGSATFSRRVRESVGEPGADLQHKRALRRRVSVDEVRSAIEAYRGQSWKDFAGRYGDWGRAMFLWAARKRCGLTLREAGEAAGGMTPWAVSAAVKRLEARAASDASLCCVQTELLAKLDGK